MSQSLHPSPIKGMPVSCAKAMDHAIPEETPRLGDAYGRLWFQIPPGKNAGHALNGKGFNSCVKLHPDRPAPTLSKMQGGKGFATVTHWRHPRPVSIPEAKRLGSFPDEFTLTGPYAQQWARIGNSVPPLLMAHTATVIAKEVFDINCTLERYDRKKPYREHLTRLWKRHLAPRSKGAPTVVSLFAGCGGSSLGYSMAGYDERLAVEWDDHAVSVFRANFPGVPVFHGDVGSLTVEEALQSSALQPGELDVLDGSPPCQGFSTAGKRQLDDPRNQLFQEYVRLLRGIRPKAFVMENVSGLVKGKMRLLFVEMLTELKSSGYAVQVRLLNAKYYDVPQARQRLIFIGVRDDLVSGLPGG